MKNIVKVGVSLVALLSLTTSVSAAGTFKPSQELNKVACNGVGAPVVDVVQKVKNDADSGVAGNAWAMDKYERHITVYKTAVAGVYCATVKYDGKFVTFAGASPANTAVLTAGIEGKMKGGYRTTAFTATLKTAPTQKKFGSVGTFDYQCDTNFVCPGRQDWTSWYFDNMQGFDLAWWGWQYKAEDGHGAWINAVSGNSGDILPTSTHKDDDNDHEDSND